MIQKIQKSKRNSKFFYLINKMKNTSRKCIHFKTFDNFVRIAYRFEYAK